MFYKRNSAAPQPSPQKGSRFGRVVAAVLVLAVAVGVTLVSLKRQRTEPAPPAPGQGAKPTPVLQATAPVPATTKPDGKKAQPPVTVPAPEPPPTSPAPPAAETPKAASPAAAHVFSGRNRKAREELLKTYGGTPATEEAVMKALRWLKAHQNEVGSWGNTYSVAMCGLALQAYLAHGETPDSEEFGDTVQRAIRHLTNQVLGSEGQIGGSAYAHGICIGALAEASAMCQIPQLVPSLEKGLRVIIDGQQQSGGWDYEYRKTERWDLSVSGWQIQALKTGHLAGAKPDGLVESLDKAVLFLAKVTYANGMFGYASPGSGSQAMQGAGAFCLQLLGDGQGAEAKAGVKWLTANMAMDWKDAGGLGTGTYAWYYHTQALFHAGTDAWPKWNEKMISVLLPAQTPDGYWFTPGPAAPEHDSYMQTAFCALILQVYYRYGPMHKLVIASTATSTMGPEAPSGGGLKMEE